jgi:phospholipase/carboxylesterase
VPHAEKVAEEVTPANANGGPVDLAHTLYEPAGAGPHPTIVMLHGWGASAHDLIGLAPFLGGGRVQMLCPQGELTVPIGNMNGFGWFPLTGSGQLFDEPAITRAGDQIRAFITRAAERYAIDRRKLVLAGFSQGGVLAYLVALSDPERFAGLAALSSWLPPPLAAMLPANEARHRLPTLVQHGSEDEIIAVARARQSVETLRGLGVPLIYREYTMGHEISAASLADLATWLDEKVLSPIVRV